jgi:8-oxo-dGTP pyrophosphatase MutT (NUDIX family)
MPISAFYRSLRDKLGSHLLLMPAVAAIIRDDAGRVLLQQGIDDRWSLPAGAIEPGESPSDAVVREVLEETGLLVIPSRIAGVVGGASCRVQYPNGDDVEYVVTVFDCSVSEVVGPPRPDETKLIAYFDLERMPALAFAYPSEMFRRPEEAAYFVKPQAS